MFRLRFAALNMTSGFVVSSEDAQGSSEMCIFVGGRLAKDNCRCFDFASLRST